MDFKHAILFYRRYSGNTRESLDRNLKQEKIEEAEVNIWEITTALFRRKIHEGRKLWDGYLSLAYLFSC
jgi:hypothetical protein